MSTRLLLLAGLITIAEVLPMSANAQERPWEGLVCRGVEESGRLIIGQPGFGPHLISLFVTGQNPLSATQALPEHVAWVNDPLHSYVPDGTGGMVIWAHPGSPAADLLALPGLTGFELNYAGSGLTFDKLADEVWRGCVTANRPFLWGFAADDTHAGGPKGLSWFCARLPMKSEAALKAALRSGAFYVSSGPVIEGLQVQGHLIRLDLGQKADVVWLRAGQYLGKAPAEELTVSTEAGENRCLRWDREVNASEFDLDRAGVPLDQLQFIRAIVRLKPGDIAQTQPLRIMPDGKIISPYPAAGEWIRGQSHNHTDTGPGGTTRLLDYRLAYQDKGELAAFSTDYSYWESPYQWLPTDRTPQISRVEPDRVPQGKAVELTIQGINFGDKPKVRLGTSELPLAKVTPESVTVEVPATLPVGQYDVTVDNDRFRGNRPLGFTVCQPKARLDGWQSFTTKDGLTYPHCISIACVSKQVWVGTMSGLSWLEDSRTGNLPVASGTIPGGTGVPPVAGTAAQPTGGTGVPPVQNWQNRTAESGVRAAYAIAAAPDGSVWMATDRGLSRCDAAGGWTQHTVGCLDNIDKNRSTERWGRMAFDKDGSLWVVNRWAAGLGLYRDGKWQRLTKADGLPGNSFVTVACDAAGTIWLGGDYGLHRKAGDKWEKVTLPAEVADLRGVTAMAAGADGSVWLALTGQPEQVAVVHLKDDKSEILRPAQGRLLPGRIRDILATRSGDTWFGTDIGVACLTAGGQWQQFTTVSSGLLANTVLGIAEGKDGKIWFATADGVSCYDSRSAR
ncbi:MAG: two-component regulator propeller domain-containing protein [Bacteroidota bacterium]